METLLDYGVIVRYGRTLPPIPPGPTQKANDFDVELNTQVKKMEILLNTL
jgi:hypothetical protein